MDLLQTHDLDCPYCGESNQIMVDCSVSSQEYIEECQICCKPINIYINVDNNNVQINATSENE